MNQPAFKPYVPASESMAELTIKAVVLGVIMAVVLGAANAYLGMKAGLTVAATVPEKLEKGLCFKIGRGVHRIKIIHVHFRMNNRLRLAEGYAMSTEIAIGDIRLPNYRISFFAETPGTTNDAELASVTFFRIYCNPIHINLLLILKILNASFQ